MKKLIACVCPECVLRLNFVLDITVSKPYILIYIIIESLDHAYDVHELDCKHIFDLKT